MAAAKTTSTKKAQPPLRHFADIAGIPPQELGRIIARGLEMKSAGGGHATPLAGKSVALIFEKPSTRTRVSFEVGVRQLGGHAVVLSRDDCHLGHGESIADTARVLSRYVDMIMLRTAGHDILLELVAHAAVPVINGLTDRTHPCQVMADIMTLAEHRGRRNGGGMPDLSGVKVAWFGDGNNVAASWIEAAAAFGFALTLAVPDACRPNAEITGAAVAAGAALTITDDPARAAEDADLLLADTWFSMGDGKARQKGEELLRPYQVNAALMARAKPDAIFMHCLPAYRGNEVTADVIDGAQSAVWDEAENRLHVQKAIMAWCMGE